MITRIPLRTKTAEYPEREQYLRFGWGYDMKRFLAVLAGDFYI